jgi:hypothetical protein
LGRGALWRGGSRPVTGQVRGGNAYWTEAVTTNNNNPYSGARLVRNCRAEYVYGDMYTDALCVIGNTINDADTVDFTLEPETFRISYSGPSTTATVQNYPYGVTQTNVTINRNNGVAVGTTATKHGLTVKSKLRIVSQDGERTYLTPVTVIIDEYNFQYDTTLPNGATTGYYMLAIVSSAGLPAGANAGRMLFVMREDNNTYEFETGSAEVIWTANKAKFSHLKAYIDTLPGWTAEVLKDDRIASTMNLSKGKGQPFPAQDVKNKTLSLYTMFDLHGDLYQTNNSALITGTVTRSNGIATFTKPAVSGTPGVGSKIFVKSASEDFTAKVLTVPNTTQFTYKTLAPDGTETATYRVATGLGTHENVVITDNNCYGIVMQDYFLTGAGGMRDCAIINNTTYNKTEQSTPYDVNEYITSQFAYDHCHVMFVHNSMAAQNLTLRTDVLRPEDLISVYTPDNYCIITNNVARNIGWSGTPSSNGVIKNNHLNTGFSSPANSTGTTIGGNETSLFVDVKTGNFTPQGELLNNLKAPAVSFDRKGVTRRNPDVPGALSAY